MKKKAIYLRPTLQVVSLAAEGQLLSGSQVNIKETTNSGKTVTNRGQVLSNEMEWDAPVWASDDNFE